ncbi:major facilitator superfamily domain-containing protein [Aspergillus sergii]|uniref:Major facilitator superfamily domain-containing protein n=1 Tax=Aspergillus sergii TaxID=1034303 RepID=A0A5N6XFG8_9EURO|nr:major facilitator superfamily domain-containing protein [Aspergillus sergii]
MGLGVLEDHQLSDVPGTARLNDVDGADNVVGNTSQRKKGRVVLSPQPSSGINDPLNWPTWKKELNIIILCFGAMLNAGTNGPLLNASYFAIAGELNVPLADVVLASGYNLLAAGCAGPFVCAASHKYGKRPVYLLSTLFAIVGTAVGEAKMEYRYLLAARVIQGFSTTAFESLILASVGDTYFVHQRGLRVGVINFILNAASSLSSIICGQVYASLGYYWLFHLFQIFLVIQFVAMLLFCPETAYRRETDTPRDSAREDRKDENIEKAESVHVEVCREEDTVDPPSLPVTAGGSTTFIRQLAVFTGVHSDEGAYKFFLGPFLALLNPAASYAILASGLLNSWYVGSAMVLSGIFSGPPWHYNAAQIGYLGIGPFIGGLIGSIIVAALSDPLITHMVRRNVGVYEPEFRLIFMPIAGMSCTIGMFLFGYTLQIGANALLCAFLHGVMMFGVLIGIFSTLSYGLDAFKPQANEIFIMNMVFKNFLFYGLSKFSSDWVADRGPEEMMYVFGGVSLFLSLLALPLYVFGKRMRSWQARKGLYRGEA